MTNDKIQMTNDKFSKQMYNLEDRTLQFSKRCIGICKLMIKDAVNIKLVDQLVRAASSIGANYREANDSITKKGFYHRIGVCRREAKETNYWLELLLHSNPKFGERINFLSDEALQLTRIFAAISDRRHYK